jgi:hypothetical protein
MVIKEEAHAEQFKEESYEENRVGGIARLENAKAMTCIYSERKEELDCKCPGIFQEIAEWSRGFP